MICFRPCLPSCKRRLRIHRTRSDEDILKPIRKSDVNDCMKKAVILITLATALSISAMAQTKEPNPADVASPEAIITAVYDVISGDAGVARDWDRFRTLFHKDAR